ncbi:MAG: hypothetical protein HC905_19810 [Bacteroidales bacterium]|nr:hypothetical protein [Bacteroidales bacterium]
MNLIKLTGTVETGNFGKGSKSEHTAVYIRTGEGIYRLREKGGNPFENESLKQFVGKTIKAEGTLDKYYFSVIPQSIEVL